MGVGCKIGLPTNLTPTPHMPIIPASPAASPSLSYTIYQRLVAQQPKHLLVRIGQNFDWQTAITACAAFHHQTGPGKPPDYTVEQLFKAILVGWVCDWSPATLEGELRNNLLVKWFAGFEIDAPTPDYQTLKRFNAWLRTHAGRVAFDAALRQIDALVGEAPRRTQVGDTFAVAAKAAREGAVTLLRHVCRKLLDALEAVQPALASAIGEQLANAALFQDPIEAKRHRYTAEERQAQLARVVRAAAACGAWVRTQVAGLAESAQGDVPAHLGYLVKVLADEYVLTYDAVGQVETVTVRDKPGPYRLGSATDPAATYRVHGPEDEQTTFGYNVQMAIDLPDLTAAVPGEKKPEVNFIREIQAYTGATPDGEKVAALLSAQAAQDYPLPEEMIYDKAAGTGKTAHAVAAATGGQTDLVTPPIDHRHHTDRFGPDRFTLSADGQALTCPHGKTSHVAHRSRTADGRNFRFIAPKCHGCPLWTQCRDPKQKVNGRSMRHVFISDYRPEANALYAAVLTLEFMLCYKRRGNVERVIANLTRYHGARTATGLGLAHVDFQMKMAATAYNLKTWAKHCFKKPT